MPTLIERIELKNFLSFGPDSPAVELGPLNVLIGPNGSGKSNLMDALDFVRTIPTGFGKAAALVGDPTTAHWRENTALPIEISVEVNSVISELWQYQIRFGAARESRGQSLRLASEVIHYPGPRVRLGDKLFVQSQLGHLGFRNERDAPVVRGFYRSGAAAEAVVVDYDRSETVFVQLRDPSKDHGISRVGDALGNASNYTRWSFGRGSNLREPQSVSQPLDRTADDWRNFQPYLNRLCGQPEKKKAILKYLDALIPGMEDIGVDTLGGRAAIWVTEAGNRLTIDRLSDGTVRVLALLSVLCDPDPPRLIALDEPEMGLHPDMIPTLADLLREASERTQVIVTTHSDILVDCFTATPGVVLVCEKRNGQTHIKPARPSMIPMKKGGQPLGLGVQWLRGTIGGKRW